MPYFFLSSWHNIRTASARMQLRIVHLWWSSVQENYWYLWTEEIFLFYLVFHYHRFDSPNEVVYVAEVALDFLGAVVKQLCDVFGYCCVIQTNSVFTFICLHRTYLSSSVSILSIVIICASHMLTCLCTVHSVVVNCIWWLRSFAW